MENNEKLDKLNTPVGDIEIERKKLETKPVKVMKIEVKSIKANLAEKVVFMCKHPDKEEPIEISSVKHAVGDNLKAVGTWFQLDADNKLQKGCGVSDLLIHYAALSLKDLEGKDLETCENKDGYLCLKAY